MRMAKPFREQIRNVVICKKLLGCIQFNRLVNGETAHEVNGLCCECLAQYLQLWRGFALGFCPLLSRMGNFDIA